MTGSTVFDPKLLRMPYYVPIGTGHRNIAEPSRVSGPISKNSGTISHIRNYSIAHKILDLPN